MFIYDSVVSGPVLDSPLLQVEAVVAPSQQPLPSITLTMPWIVPSHPDYPYEANRFAADLGGDACAELLSSLEFRSFRWTSPTCKVIAIVKTPTHGTLINEGNGIYGFKIDQPGRLGTDRVQYLIEGVDGRRMLVTTLISMRTLGQAFSVNGEKSNQYGNAAEAWKKQVTLGAVVSAASGGSYSFSAPPGTAVGNTSGSVTV